jgi:uncharacterized repeat protein (TIGR03803 family)
MSRFSIAFVALAVITLTLFLSVTRASAQTEKVLHSFDYNGRDGRAPYSNLIFDAKGNLYGTTTLRFAALSDLALVPVHATGQNEQVLYGFTSEPNGIAPIAGLVQDKAGALYGTLPEGGQYAGGTVFKLTPPTKAASSWTETTIYSFPATLNDGADPVDRGSLVFDKAGNLYGTTEAKGEFGYGTVFELTPPTSGETWTEAILYSFGSGADAESPASGLTIAGGLLYGTTYYGGKSGAGAVFKVTPPRKAGGAWTETVLYSFTGGSDGGGPSASPAVSSSGVLYGTAGTGGLYGNGVVYELSPPAEGSTEWTETVLHNFPEGKDDGLSPSAAVILDKQGNLYGTTSASSGPFPYGLVFELASPTWEETILYNFTDRSDGEYPQGALTLDSGGALYGTTTGSGEQGGNQGSVFKLSPPDSLGGAWTETTLHSFTGGSDGGTPFDGLLLKGNLLYGTTGEGGPQKTCNCGVVFAITK